MDLASSRPAPAQFRAVVGHRRHVGIRGRYGQGVNPIAALAQIAEDGLGFGRSAVCFHHRNGTIADNVELVSGNGWDRTKVPWDGVGWHHEAHVVTVGHPQRLLVHGEEDALDPAGLAQRVHHLGGHHHPLLIIELQHRIAERNGGNPV